MQGSLCDVEHLRTVNTAIVIHLLDDESKGEGRDVQHVEQRGLAGTNLVASPDQIDVTLGERCCLVTDAIMLINILFGLTSMCFFQ